MQHLIQEQIQFIMILIAFCTVIWGYVTHIVKRIEKRNVSTIKQTLVPIEEKIDTILSTIIEDSLFNCKQHIMNIITDIQNEKELSTEKKSQLLNLYKRYKSLGGNGEVEAKVKLLIGELID